jgi:hypothetical protein
MELGSEENRLGPSSERNPADEMRRYADEQTCLRHGMRDVWFAVMYRDVLNERRRRELARTHERCALRARVCGGVKQHERHQRGSAAACKHGAPHTRDSSRFF